MCILYLDLFFFLKFKNRPERGWFHWQLISRVLSFIHLLRLLVTGVGAVCLEFGWLPVQRGCWSWAIGTNACRAGGSWGVDWEESRALYEPSLSSAPAMPTRPRTSLSPLLIFPTWIVPPNERYSMYWKLVTILWWLVSHYGKGYPVLQIMEEYSLSSL